MTRAALDALAGVLGLQRYGFEVRIPILTDSPNKMLNAHWSTNMKRARKHKSAVEFVLSQQDRPTLPVIVTMIRCSSRVLDAHENLPMSFKHMVDSVAKWLRVDDADERVTWKYEQVKTTRKEAGTRIRVEEVR